MQLEPEDISSKNRMPVSRTRREILIAGNLREILVGNTPGRGCPDRQGKTSRRQYRTQYCKDNWRKQRFRIKKQHNHLNNNKATQANKAQAKTKLLELLKCRRCHLSVND